MNINPTTHDNLSAALLSRAKHGSVIIGLDEIDLAQLGITQSTHVSAAFAAHGFATADPAAHALATADIATSTATAHDPATASPYTARRLRLTQRDGFALHSATASPYAARRLRLTQRDGFALRKAATPTNRARRADVRRKSHFSDFFDSLLHSLMGVQFYTHFQNESQIFGRRKRIYPARTHVLPSSAVC